MGKHEAKTSENKKGRKVLKIFIAIILLGILTVGFLLYGPYPKFRNWLITTAMTTMNHQYLDKWFYSDKTIDDVLKKKYESQYKNVLVFMKIMILIT